ncbi:hypothetical protein GCM10010156_49340 [Planobispora rosea]|uniref:Uncharacterized protein n=1 Tax=Planobispora rosea TaxID=35762 RepID=A0A8J3S430_PLARO|nr:hypothetical protein [Planobispora rosea]GGS84850.1 hypothetical protein GCM10010156_49340 [Planobispora rosea]GIH86445.1 hypothetical protein Pro02_48530 [Planobispora rosea]
MFAPPSTAHEFLARHRDRIRQLTRRKIPSASFLQVGASIVGVIVEEPILVFQTEYGTRKLLTFDDGTPRKQLRVVLATEQRDPANPDDNGLRALYLKTGRADAVAAAMERVNAEDLEIGGVLSLTFTGYDHNPDGYSTKVFTAEYVPPTGTTPPGTVPQQSAPPAAALIPAAVAGPAPLIAQSAAPVVAPPAPAMPVALTGPATPVVAPAPAAPVPGPASATAISPDTRAHLEQLGPEVLAQLGITLPTSSTS